MTLSHQPRAPKLQADEASPGSPLAQQELLLNQSKPGCNINSTYLFDAQDLIIS